MIKLYQAAIKILSETKHLHILCRPNLLIMIGFKLVELSIKYGNNYYMRDGL